MGVGADDALLGEPAGGLKPSTEAAVKEELQKQVGLPSLQRCCMLGVAQHTHEAWRLVHSAGCPAGPYNRALAAVARPPAPQAPDPPANHGRFFSRLLQALSGSLGGGKQDKEEDDSDDYGSGGSSGGGGRVSGGAPPPTQQPRSGQQQGSEPPSGLQMAAAAAGLAALPVVGWSEYVLRTTGTLLRRVGQCGKVSASNQSFAASGNTPDRFVWVVPAREDLHTPNAASHSVRSVLLCFPAGCGLPPGPGGLLGAAEGVSYLVVGGVVLWSLARKLGTGSGGSREGERGEGGGAGRHGAGVWHLHFCRHRCTALALS